MVQFGSSVWLRPLSMSFLSRRPQDTSQNLSIGGLSQGGWWRSCIRPLWLLSLGLHLLVLRIPLPATQPQPQTTKSVKITKLSPIPKSSVTPFPQSKATATNPKPNPKTIATAPVQQPDTIPPTKSVQSPTLPKVTPTSSPIATPKPQTTSEPLSGTELKKLLQFPNAKIACGGNCAETTASLSEVATYFNKKLTSANLKVEPLIQEPTRQVLKLPKTEPTQFLSILTRASNTIYALADQAVSLEDLKRAEESVPSISDILGSIKGLEPVTESAIAPAQQKLFEGRDDALIESKNLLTGMKPEDVWNTYLDQELKANGFNVFVGPTSYGGGPVYIIRRSLSVSYLNLVPSEDGTGTVVVFWKVPPH